MRTSQEIAQEYDEAALSVHEYEKVKWGSQKKMMNRFRCALRNMPTHDGITWLDVGCGTGAFQSIVPLRGMGIDLSAQLIQYATAREDTNGSTFRVIDFLDVDYENIDVITCIGVLQKTNMSVHQFFQKAHEVLSPGGTVYVDTKHLGWKGFRTLQPNAEHEWFTLGQLYAGMRRARIRPIKVSGVDVNTGEEVHPSASHNLITVGVK